MHYLAEMPCEEISEFLGVSLNTIKSRLHRARKRLGDARTSTPRCLRYFPGPTDPDCEHHAGSRSHPADGAFCE